MIGEHVGRVIDTVGDGILAELSSVLGAVNCALTVQRRWPNTTPRSTLPGVCRSGSESIKVMWSSTAHASVGILSCDAITCRRIKQADLTGINRKSSCFSQTVAEIRRYPAERAIIAKA
jgi:hypothetical protein